MKRVAFLLLAPLALFAATIGQTPAYRGAAAIQGKPASGGGTTCLALAGQSQDVNNNYGNYSDGLSQLLKISSSATICKVRLFIRNFDPPEDAQVEFWTGANRTGSQIGTTSARTTLTGFMGDFAWFDFTWTSNPTLTTDCYIALVMPDGATTVRWGAANISGGTYYENATYCLYVGATALGDFDSNFELFSMQ